MTAPKFQEYAAWDIPTLGSIVIGLIATGLHCLK